MNKRKCSFETNVVNNKSILQDEAKFLICVWCSIEIPAQEGWICDFESGKACGNFNGSGWVSFSPKLHTVDTQYEPEVDHTFDSSFGKCSYSIRRTVLREYIFGELKAPNCSVDITG